MSERVGALGIFGAFHNDHEFHPYANNYPNNTFGAPVCAPTDAHGHAYFAEEVIGEATNASDNPGCEPRWDRPPGILTTAARRRGSHIRKSARFCPASKVRDVFYGLLGPDATKIAYRTPNGEVHTEHTVGSGGAYLVALPHNPHIGARIGEDQFGRQSPIVGIAWRTGHDCGVLGPRNSDGDLTKCHVQGYVKPHIKTPSTAQVQRPLKIRRRRSIVSVSFRAPVAVHDTRSYYAVLVKAKLHRNPNASPHRGCGIIEASTNRNIRANARITFMAGLNGPCHGTARGIVEYVINRGPVTGHRGWAIPLAVARKSHGKYTVRIVGGFHYSVPNEN